MPREGRVCTPILDGADADYIYFRVQSWSRSALFHDLTIDKRTGEVRCKCEDAVCRTKRPSITDILDPFYEGPTCKHMRELVRVYRTSLGL